MSSEHPDGVDGEECESNECHIESTRNDFVKEAKLLDCGESIGMVD